MTIYTIASVERDTGISKDTLRVWEKRYGFPQPERDAHGDRVYPVCQVEQLRLIRRLLDQGRRPSKVVGQSLQALQAQLQEAPAQGLQAEAGEEAGALADFLELIRLARSAELRAHLQQQVMKQGLQGFVSNTLPQLNQAVGNAWLRGELAVPEEHLYTEQMQNVLRAAIGTQPTPGCRPRVLLTTLPEEQHQLGLLMVEAMLVPEGSCCVSLGVQTPVQDICEAAVKGGFDIVALSFSEAFPPRQAVDGLRQVRALLPGHIAIWAGGGALRDRQCRLDNVLVMNHIGELGSALHTWRAAHTDTCRTG